MLAYVTGCPHSLYSFSNIGLSVLGKQCLFNWQHIDYLADRSEFETCLNHNME